MTSASEQNEPPPLSEVMAHIRARSRQGAAIFATFLGVSLLCAALLTPKFTATAVLAVLPAPEFTVRQSAGSHAFSTSALALDQIMKAETEILESAELHSVTVQAITLARLYPDLESSRSGGVARALSACIDVLLSPWRVRPTDPAAARLELGLARFDNHLRVLPAKDANIITVTFVHPDRFMAAHIVNSLLARYAERRRQLYDDPQLAAVRHETESLGHAVGNAESNIAMFKAKNQLTDEAVERDLLVRRQSAEAQALADAQSQVMENRVRALALDHQIAMTTSVVALYQERDPDTRLQAIDASLVSLRAQLASSRLHYQESSRHVRDLVGQLNVRLLDRHHVELDPSASAVRQGRNSSYDALLLARAVAATDQAAAQSRVTALQDELNRIAGRLAAMPQLEARLAELVRRRAVADAAFANASRVLAEQHMTEAEDALRLANVRVIEAARVPQRPNETGTLVMIAGILFGIVSASSWMIVGPAIRQTLLTPEGLAHATGLPVLGVFTRGAPLHQTFPAPEI
jgi:uncharacterized protein involved in exopolysaccharide biosynthesis